MNDNTKSKLNKNKTVVITKENIKVVKTDKCDNYFCNNIEDKRKNRYKK